MRTPKQALIDSLALILVIVAAVIHICYIQLINSDFNLESVVVGVLCWFTIGIGYKVLTR